MCCDTKLLVCKHLLMKMYRARLLLSSLAEGSRWLHAHGRHPEPWTYDHDVFTDEDLDSSGEMNIWPHSHSIDLKESFISAYSNASTIPSRDIDSYQPSNTTITDGAPIPVG